MKFPKSKLIRLSILLVLLLNSGCIAEGEAVVPPTMQTKDIPGVKVEEATSTPAPKPEVTVAADPSDPPEDKVIDILANADVLFVRAVKDAEPNSWTFHVTVSHPDTGWEDYADGWDVVLPDGNVIKPDPEDPFTRLLLHPHEAEQPFTRSQSGILIPDGVTKVQVRAHDLVDGFGGDEVTVDLDSESGPGFEIVQ